MTDKDKVLINIKLRRAEEAPQNVQEQLGKKEGMYIEERYLSRKDLKKEFDEIIKTAQISIEKSFAKYIEFMRKSVGYAIDKVNE